MTRSPKGRYLVRIVFVILAALVPATFVFAVPPGSADPPGPPAGHGPPITPPGLVGNARPAGAAFVVTSTVKEYTVPTAASGPLDITLGSDGNIWFTEFFSGNIGRITSVGTVTEFPGPIFATGITSGPDGHIWVTDPTNFAILRFNVSTGAVMNTYAAGGKGEGITTGPDGALWFAEPEGKRIGRITTTGLVTHYPVPSSDGDPQSIVAGPDGNLWFTEFTAGRVGRITPLGVVTEFALPDPKSQPAGICHAGTDVWFTEFAANRVARISTQGSNTITEYALPSGKGPRACAAEPGETTIYFTEATSGGIGRITANGSLLGEATFPNLPRRITAGADNAMWFTEPVANIVGRLPIELTLPN